MPRLLVILLALAPSLAWAHVPGAPPPFIFLTPQGGNNAPTAGKFEFEWLDDDVDQRVMINLFVTPEAIPPFPLSAAADAFQGTRVTPADIVMADATNKFTWDTTGFAPGCYQPFAGMRDPDGSYLNVAAGKIVVPGPTNTPPTIWFTNPANDAVKPDGTFTLRYQVIDPDDDPTVTLKYGRGNVPETLVTLADNIHLVRGRTDATYVWDVRGLPAGPYAVYAEVKTGDGAHCATYWTHTVSVLGGPYATDGGTPDAAAPVTTMTTPPDASGPPPFVPDTPPPGVGCACSIGDGASLFAGLAAALLFRRRR